jgi:hypothetical protein
MNSATLFLMIFAAVLAFWAGSRWRHNARTWTDTKAAKVGWKTMKKTRWITLKAALIAALATIVYLVGTGAISLANVKAPARPHSTPNSSSGHAP